MKISRTWLQRYFATELPSVEEIADSLTFHAFEIEGIEGDVLDVKILPDRASYALSHRGVARELSAILGLPLTRDSLREPLPVWTPTAELSLTLDTQGKTLRKMGALVRGVSVGPSPAGLKEAIESMGQRSINNVVDATNFVTLDMGQPLHAFDAGKIAWHDGALSIGVRAAHTDEEITVLTGEVFTLPQGALVISDAVDGTALDIAGIKGGAASGITTDTTDLFVSVCNFDAASIRKTAQALNLFTDASVRFQNKLSPELAAYGMRDVLALITDVAGGEVIGVNDVYPEPAGTREVVAPLERINGVLGTTYSTEEVSEVFRRLGLEFSQENDTYTVVAPFERRDLVIAEDLAEEVGRVMGYEKIPSQSLPALPVPSASTFAGLERIRDTLRERGFTEISTQTFANAGSVVLANPLDKTRPALRTQLTENMQEALTRAVQAAPRVLGTARNIHLFEIGSIFPKEGESLSLSLGVRTVAGKANEAALKETVEAISEVLGFEAPAVYDHSGVAEISLAQVDLAGLSQGYIPTTITLGAYHPFSVYPFALRDVAVWTPSGTEESEVAVQILKAAGDHLVRIDLFDRFEKDSRVSYAFRLVFESNTRTLSDVDLDPAMERIAAALHSKEGWEVR